MPSQGRLPGEKKPMKNNNNIEMKEHSVSPAGATQPQGWRARQPDRDSDNATNLSVLYLLDTAQVVRGVPLQHHPLLRENVDAGGRNRSIRRALP